MQMDTDVMTYEQLMDLEDSMGVVSRGLREEQRKQLLARRQTSRVDESANCSICLAGGDVEIELECGH
jgi:hypothetical protein